jgi:hypothetical protein
MCRVRFGIHRDATIVDVSIFLAIVGNIAGAKQVGHCLRVIPRRRAD